MHRPHPQEPMPQSPFQSPRPHYFGGHPQCLPVRKNACIVCGICFTCSKNYGTDCTCSQVQPRRGKNLPEGCLDSRAKKLHPENKDDYEFTVAWLTEFAHSMYKDASGQVVGLRDLPEVSLCKAHSSTLYRAKKRHDRSKNETQPSPTGSNGVDVVMEPARSLGESYSTHSSPSYPYYGSTALGESRLAAKAQERSSQQASSSAAVHHPTDGQPPHGLPDLGLVPSTSLKRKRESKQHPPLPFVPHSSSSAPLYNAGVSPFLPHHPPSSSSASAASPPQRHHHHHEHADGFPSHLPPLHTREPSLSSSMQHQLQLSSSPYPSVYSSRPSAFDSQASPSLHTTPHHVVETVSLKSVAASPDAPPMYHVRNLAITDTFTFRDLLAEIDMTGTPPPGKRIAISDENNARIFPLDQPIRRVILNPPSPHVDLCLGLAEKTSIDWSSYT